MQTSQTGGQWYSDTSPFSVPWPNLKLRTLPKQLLGFLSFEIATLP